MKKSILLLNILAIMLCLAACTESSRMLLKKEILAGNKECPIIMTGMGSITNMNYDEDENDVEITMLIDAEYFDIDNVRANKELLENSMATAFSRGEAKKVGKMVVMAKASMTFKLIDSQTGESVSVTVPYEKLEASLNDKRTEAQKTEELLQSAVKAQRSALPMELEDGLTLTEVYDNGKNLVYVCDVDEDLYGEEMIDELILSMDEVKEGIASTFDTDVTRNLIGNLCILNKGMIYRYRGSNSGKTADMQFTPQELKAYR